MPDNDSGEKTEEPTVKRRNEARDKGQVAQSQEIANALAILFAVLVFSMGGAWMLHKFSIFTKDALANLNYDLTVTSTQTLFYRNIGKFFSLVLPMALVMMIVGVIGTIVQIGFLFTTKTLEPKMDALRRLVNPVEGFQQMFQPEALQNLVKSLLKLLLLSVIYYFTLHGELEVIMTYADLSIGQILSRTGDLIIRLLLNIFYFYLFIAIADFAFTRWRQHEKLKMSKSEVKDEFRQLEGDPQVRSKLRSMMMQSSMRRMAKEVPESDVVITNPTHIAVALRYRRDKDNAPIVTAKGKLKFAQRIKAIAMAHKVPIVEDVALARALYKTCRVGSSISVELYAAVAEILARVYRMKN